MKQKIYIGKLWGKQRQDRLGVIVELENNKGDVFKYAPSYHDLIDIKNKLDIVEKLNYNKCITPFNIKV